MNLYEISKLSYSEIAELPDEELRNTLKRYGWSQVEVDSMSRKELLLNIQIANPSEQNSHWSSKYFIWLELFWLGVGSIGLIKGHWDTLALFVGLFVVTMFVDYLINKSFLRKQM